MDYGRENVVQVIATENWSNDQSVWATEDDYRAFIDLPPSKKSKSSSSSSSQSEPSNSNSNNNRSKAIGKMFFKTKLCCKFRAGTCPYVTNCNFAHSIEELRRPPPNWQEIVAAHDDDKTGPPSSPEAAREEFQIPSVGSSSGFAVETPRSYKGRHCKKFYTEEGCPYGDNCTFLHDEQSKNRESVATSLGPGGYGGSSGGGGGGVGVAAGGSGSSGAGAGGGGGVVVIGAGAAAAAAAGNLKPSNWKTRICNKWELTGYCPFGSKCHFAHGQTELHRYGGGLVETEARDSSSSVPAENNNKQPSGVPSKISAENSAAVALVGSSVPLSDVYHIGVPSQRPSVVIQRPPHRAHQKWKGPDKISRIYGDWIDDIE